MATAYRIVKNWIPFLLVVAVLTWLATAAPPAPVSIVGSNIWTNDGGAIRPSDTNNQDVWFAQISRSLHIRDGELSIFSHSSIGLFDMYAYERGTNDNVGFLGFGLDGAYGDTIAIDPADDNTLPQPFLFSTTTNYVISASNPLFAIANAHSNQFTLSGSGQITLAATTNHITFGSTNTAPVSAVAPTKWISVRVSGEGTVYRMPLYQ